MIQHRVFVPNITGADIDITDPSVQSILKTGERVAFVKNDIIYYAMSPSQESWYALCGDNESDPASTSNINVLNAKQLTDESGNHHDVFNITKEQMSDVKGNRWWVVTISDTGLQHKDVRTSHASPKNNAIKDVISSTSCANAEAYDFENILAMIFKAEILSVNHKQGNMTKSDVTTNLVRKYSENNLVNYGIHVDQMVVLNGDGTETSFANIPAGQYKFSIAKIVHPSVSSGIADIQKIVVGAYKSGACCLIRAIVSKNSLTILNSSYTGCDERDVNISIETRGGVSTVYMNVTINGENNNNSDRWICNASVTGYEHTRFPSLLADRFHAVVGTSYDCFGSASTIDEYTASMSSSYQERYHAGKMSSRGYPYVIRINIKPNPDYQYIPTFTPSEDKLYSMSIDGIEYWRYTAISADNKSLVYDAAYEKPEGTLLFSYRDVYNQREYTCTYKIDDLRASSIVYTTESVDGRTCYVLDIDVTVTRGRANLNSVDGISFIAYAVTPSYSEEAIPNYNATGFDLDSSLVSPMSSTLSQGEVQIKTRSYIAPASSYLGITLNESDSAYNVGYVENAINTYCSGDNRANARYSICSFPYITLPEEFKQQSSGIESYIIGRLSDSGVNESSTYSYINNVVGNITGSRISVTQEEYNALDKTSISSIQEDLSSLISRKLKAQWSGEIVTSELYYFNTGHPWFDVAAVRNAQDKYTFTGGQSNIPSLIINDKREIYNMIFTLYRNTKRDDLMNISLSDIETQTITFGRSSASNPPTVVACPVSLTRTINGVQYKYKLSHQQEVSARVLKEHSYAFCCKDNNTLKDVTPAIFSFLYKIEPDTGKTAADYPSDDYFLGDPNYPLSIYDPDRQSRGCWLMLHPLLNGTPDGMSPLDFAVMSDNATESSVNIIQEWHADTHIIKKNDIYYYATAYNVFSNSAASYDALPDDFVQKAIEVGLPLFSVVFFDVKAINPLSVNLRRFLQKTIMNYINNYISSNPGATINDVPGITNVSDVDKTAKITIGNAGGDMLTTIKRILVSASNETNVIFAYGDASLENGWPISIDSVGCDVLYGKYNYNTDPSIDDWEFEFVTE